MASVETLPNGRRKVRFRDYRGNERALAVGKIPKRAAESAAKHIQGLVNAKIGGLPPEPDHMKWAADQKPRIVDYLAGLELIPPRVATEPEPEPDPVPMLGAWFDQYINGRRKIADSTKTTWKRAKRLAVNHFGNDRPIDQITIADALEWFEKMQDTHAENTARKMIGITRQVFRRAVKAELITNNPFNDDELPVTIGAKEKQYIELSVIADLVKVLPSTEWKAVVVLARVAGLRTPSEPSSLKWCDIDWENNRMAVQDLKRKKTKSIPLFPDVRKVLEDLLEVTGGGEYVLRALREKSGNWGTPPEKMMTRAGIKPWPALFNSLRSSASIDVEREYGSTAENEWIGHSEHVSLKHYRRTTETDYAAAVASSPKMDTRMDTNLHELERTMDTEQVLKRREPVVNPYKTSVLANSPKRSRWSLQDSNL
ncbi:MAG: site-specific integrase [Pirellulaceae bacterium]|nr:site-specific integrase [Pirellulaceae bacterium]